MKFTKAYANKQKYFFITLYQEKYYGGIYNVVGRAKTNLCKQIRAKLACILIFCRCLMMVNISNMKILVKNPLFLINYFTT